MKGKKLGLEDERNFLFKEYLKLVEILQPEVFVIENVKSLLSTAGGYFREQILEYIGRLGYRVNYGVLNAKDFGVPQARERAIFICSKSKSIELPVGKESGVTVRDVISDLAYLQSAEGSFESDYQFEAQSEYQRKMRKNSDRLFNHQATAHSKVALEKLAMIPAEKGKESSCWVCKNKTASLSSTLFSSQQAFSFSNAGICNDSYNLRNKKKKEKNEFLVHRMPMKRKRSEDDDFIFDEMYKNLRNNRNIGINLGK